MLAEQTVLLASPGGRRASWLYAAGTATVLGVLVAAVLLVGRSLSLPSAPHLDAALDLWIGGGLLVLAAGVRLLRPRNPKTTRRQRELSPPEALGFGTFAMATNATTLALVVAAARELAAAPVASWERVLVGVLLVVLGCLPAWGPVALVSSAPRAADVVLDRVESLLRKYGRTLVELLLAGGGLLLVGRGILRLTGL